jgi:hypothetical protein
MYNENKMYRCCLELLKVEKNKNNNKNLIIIKNYVRLERI